MFIWSWQAEKRNYQPTREALGCLRSLNDLFFCCVCAGSCGLGWLPSALTKLFHCALSLSAFCPWVIGQTWSHFNPNLPPPVCFPPGKQICLELKGCTLQRRSGPVRSGEQPSWAGFVKGAELMSQLKFLLRSLSRHCSKLTTVGYFCLKKIYWKLWQ